MYHPVLLGIGILTEYLCTRDSKARFSLLSDVSDVDYLFRSNRGGGFCQFVEER
jgi:hypothetical protein